MVIDPAGELLDLQPPRDLAPATLLVTPVTDALKRVSAGGRVVESLDRDRFWAVSAFALGAEVLQRLEGEYTTAEELYMQVVGAGLPWSVAPMPGAR